MGTNKVVAVGRGGLVSVRESHFPSGQGWAVDGKVPDSRHEHLQNGGIIRFYNDRAKAQAFADQVNRGEHTVRGKRSTDAIVVPAYNFAGISRQEFDGLRET